MGRHVLLTDENQSEVLGHLIDFDRTKGPWRVQRPDGRYYSGVSGGHTNVSCFTADAAHAADWSTAAGAQHFIDIHQGSAKSRIEFHGCKPVCVLPLFEAGDFIVCACGRLHEADYCPSAGHGAVL